LKPLKDSGFLSTWQLEKHTLAVKKALRALPSQFVASFRSGCQLLLRTVNQARCFGCRLRPRHDIQGLYDAPGFLYELRQAFWDSHHLTCDHGCRVDIRVLWGGSLPGYISLGNRPHGFYRRGRGLLPNHSNAHTIKAEQSWLSPRIHTSKLGFYGFRFI